MYSESRICNFGETCPHCGAENEIENYDIKKKGFVIKCQECGAEMFLCNECWDEDNPNEYCNWHEETINGRRCGVCLRGIAYVKED